MAHDVSIDEIEIDLDNLRGVAGTRLEHVNMEETESWQVDLEEIAKV